jgi:hypothetical protein
MLILHIPLLLLTIALLHGLRQRYDSYPPNAYKLFYDDQLRKEKMRQLLLQEQEHQQRMSNSPDTTQVATIALVSSSESLSTSYIQNYEEQPQSQPQQQRRTPTKFTLFIQKVTKLWNEISIEEKKIWEQRAEIAVAILQERSGENSRTPSQSCTVSSTQQLMVNQQ